MDKVRKKYADEREVSLLTGIAVQTLRNHRYLGRGFPYSKMGKTVLYNMDDIIAFIESKKVRASR